MGDSADASTANHGWRVTFAGLGINLALGVLYSWSVIAGGTDSAGWGWTATQKAMPYSVACLVFCLIMVPAGRMQDKLGPRIVATIGGVLVGLGMIVCSFTTTPMGFIIGFGVLCGAGFGFGYRKVITKYLFVLAYPDAATASSSGSLDHHRIADFFAQNDGFIKVSDTAGTAGNDRHPGIFHDFLRCNFITGKL